MTKKKQAMFATPHVVRRPGFLPLLLVDMVLQIYYCCKVTFITMKTSRWILGRCRFQSRYRCQIAIYIAVYLTYNNQELRRHMSCGDVDSLFLFFFSLILGNTENGGHDYSFWLEVRSCYCLKLANSSLCYY